VERRTPLAGAAISAAVAGILAVVLAWVAERISAGRVASAADLR
jgi:hypothetical protein